MIIPQLKHLIRPSVLVGRAIWPIITGSVHFYFIIVYVLEGGDRSAGLPGIGVVEAFLYFAAAAVAVTSGLYRRHCFSHEHMIAILRKGVDIGAPLNKLEGENVDSGRLALLRTLSESEKRAPDFKRMNSLWRDEDLLMHRDFGAAKSSVYLIRPDGYIGFRKEPASLSDLLEYLSIMFL